MVVITERKTKEARREEILDAAFLEFAELGFHAASTEAIARRAGISQPYVFRLFGTKKELFRAVVARCFRETLEMFQRAAEGLRGAEALEAIGKAYIAQLSPDPIRLRAQMHAYASCDDPELGAVVRDGFGDLVAYVERVSGLPAEDVSLFIAKGMLMTVLSSMQVQSHPEPWAQRLIAGCGKEL